CQSLVEDLPDLQDAGLKRFRLSPQDCDMVAVARIHDEVLKQVISPDEGAARLRKVYPDVPLSNGFLHGNIGAAWISRQRSAAEHKIYAARHSESGSSDVLSERLHEISITLPESRCINGKLLQTGIEASARQSQQLGCGANVPAETVQRRTNDTFLKTIHLLRQGRRVGFRDRIVTQSQHDLFGIIAQLADISGPFV